MRYFIYEIRSPSFTSEEDAKKDERREVDVLQLGDVVLRSKVMAGRKKMQASHFLVRKKGYVVGQRTWVGQRLTGQG